MLGLGSRRATALRHDETVGPSLQDSTSVSSARGRRGGYHVRLVPYRPPASRVRRAFFRHPVAQLAPFTTHPELPKIPEASRAWLHTRAGTLPRARAAKITDKSNAPSSVGTAVQSPDSPIVIVPRCLDYLIISPLFALNQPPNATGTTPEQPAQGAPAQRETIRHPTPPNRNHSSPTH